MKFLGVLFWSGAVSCLHVIVALDYSGNSVINQLIN